MGNRWVGGMADVARKGVDDCGVSAVVGREGISAPLPCKVSPGSTSPIVTASGCLTTTRGAGAGHGELSHKHAVNGGRMQTRFSKRCPVTQVRATDRYIYAHRMQTRCKKYNVRSEYCFYSVRSCDPTDRDHTRVQCACGRHLHRMHVWAHEVDTLADLHDGAACQHDYAP